MASQVKDERVRRTEARLVAAATSLFVRDGYAATTLAAVAREAGLAPRTVYVRFGTKAALLQRCVEVALAGDDEPVTVPDRPWVEAALGAPTLDGRIRAFAAAARSLFERAGPVLAVSAQAEVSEPDVAAASQAGRLATAALVRRFWEAAEPLLPDGADVAWLAETTAALASADTYLHVVRTYGWDAADHERWTVRTWTALAGAPSPAPPPGA